MHACSVRTTVQVTAIQKWSISAIEVPVFLIKLCSEKWTTHWHPWEKAVAWIYRWSKVVLHMTCCTRMLETDCFCCTVGSFDPWSFERYLHVPYYRPATISAVDVWGYEWLSSLCYLTSSLERQYSVLSTGSLAFTFSLICSTQPSIH